MSQPNEPIHHRYFIALISAGAVVLAAIIGGIFGLFDNGGIGEGSSAQSAAVESSIPDSPDNGPSTSAPAAKDNGDAPTSSTVNDEPVVSSRPTPSPPGTAGTRFTKVTITEGMGVDLDTREQSLLPVGGTVGLDLAIDGGLYSPEGPDLVRVTAEPTLTTCADPQDGQYYYDDYTPGQWFCFGTSEGVPGYFQIDDVAEISEGMRVTADVYLRKN